MKGDRSNQVWECYDGEIVVVLQTRHGTYNRHREHKVVSIFGGYNVGCPKIGTRVNLVGIQMT